VGARGQLGNKTVPPNPASGKPAEGVIPERYPPSGARIVEIRRRGHLLPDGILWWWRSDRHKLVRGPGGRAPLYPTPTCPPGTPYQ